MKCPKCGTNNKQNYCLKCGAMITKDGTIVQINIAEKKTIFDDLEIFIGNNASKIIYKGFNFMAGFLTPFYLLYRKCYLEGTILLISEYFSTLLFFYIINGPLRGLPPVMGLWIAGFLCAIHIIFFGSTINSYYLYRSKKKIEKLKSTPNFKIEDLTKHGGTSLFGLIIIPSIFWLIVIICMFLGIRIL